MDTMTGRVIFVGERQETDLVREVETKGRIGGGMMMLIHQTKLEFPGCRVVQEGPNG